MKRTWDHNRAAINQLWPAAQFTDEEKRLWNDDLSGLDQDTLYDAIRHAKRSHDAVYPQLKWILDAYREFANLKRAALRKGSSQSATKKVWKTNDACDREACDEMMEWIERAEPQEYQNIFDKIYSPDMFKRLHSISASRLQKHAQQRLLGISPKC
jgi:hypothetical protein